MSLSLGDEVTDKDRLSEKGTSYDESMGRPENSLPHIDYDKGISLETPDIGNGITNDIEGDDPLTKENTNKTPKLDKVSFKEGTDGDVTDSISQSPMPMDKPSERPSQRKELVEFLPPQITPEMALGTSSSQLEDKDGSKISAYARLDFENYTFFVQTLQVVLGRKSNDELLNGSHHAVDVHLSSKKAISRRHAKIFYNFGTQRFELSILGRNGAFMDDLFVEKGMTVPLIDGSKIQIGDILFSFILPSLELEESKDLSVTSKTFNPNDAISLRSNLYTNSNPTTPKSSDKKETRPRLNSLRGSKLPRRLSEARRKSLATATDEEINTILSEIGVTLIDDIDEQDPDVVDSQIKAILNEGPGDESAIIEDDDDNNNNNNNNAQDHQDHPMGENYMEGEEDEIDKLVKQHNLDQGVVLDESILERDDNDIDMDLSALDQEIISLGPLINDHSHALLREKEEKRRRLEEEKRTRQTYLNGPNIQRNGPLMGKPAMPRMGKPASIQPPASRLYGRPQVPGNMNKDQYRDNRLTTVSSPMAGLPTHLVAQGPDGNYPLRLAQGNFGHQLSKSYLPSRPPAPDLLVPIETITQQKLPLPMPPVDKITVDITHQESICEPKFIDDNVMVPKVPKRRRDIFQTKKPIKNIYTINEIPEHYRTKPTLTFPVMIINVLKYKDESNGLTLPDINEGIKEIYPYYKYCPDGWQSVVTHNVKLNKMFKCHKPQPKDINDETDTNAEIKWSLDDSFIEEKEKVRKKQQEIAAQKAKEAAIRAEELKQKQRLEMQQSISQNIVGRDLGSPYGLPLNSNLLSQSQLLAQLHQKQTSSYQTNNGSKPKTIAELASEIRRDNGAKYFKSSGDQASPSVSGSNDGSPSTIKAQLAANRAQYSHTPPSGSQSPNKQQTSLPMNQDTKKSLAYLQKELFTLYKARKLSYNTATTTEIITKALATTIAQVNVIGSKAGVGDNALSFLVEKAPQQVSKILDIALTKSIKEKQGLTSSRQSSQGATPGGSQVPSPQKQPTEMQKDYTPTPISNIVKEANEQHEKSGHNETTDNANNSNNKELSRPQPGNRLAKPGYNKSPGLSASARPSGLSNHPQFLSNKPPSRPGYSNKPNEPLTRPTFASSASPSTPAPAPASERHANENENKRPNDSAASEQLESNKQLKQE